MILSTFSKFHPKYTLSRRLISGLNVWKDELSPEIKHKIEAHWKEKLFQENKSHGEKYYVLSMFPYPSGSLHMGHVRVYTISDAIARFQRMNGKNVIHPIGWDAFGLPAENAAIERQIAPEEWTERNITQMKTQLKQLGCSFDWHRELATCDPQYYHWTQDLFLKLYEAGLAYQKEAMVNWDPVDQTVLADEQIDVNGCSWRSGAKVEKKPLKQWFIRTTRYARDLFEGLNDEVLQDWRDIIKLQRHWIGECDGVNFDFELINGKNNFITLWTTKPEHVKEAKFVAISDTNILANLEGTEVISGTRKLNIKARNPFSGEKIPIFVTNQIEFLPQTDSFLGIPSICEQSATFSINHGIPFEPCGDKMDDVNKRNIVQNQICEQAKQLKIGGYWSSAKLRDWLISRQRFWGTPIPIIHCPKCGTVPVPKKDLPVKLPKLSTSSEKKGSSQLSKCSDWVNVKCPKCQGSAKREVDTMDTFVDSSWYYLRYLDPKNSEKLFDANRIRNLIPVDLYIGGKEHAVLHMYYARFISHFLHSIGLVPEREPFKRLLVQGMVMGRSYRVKGSGQYVHESKVDVLDLKKNKAVMKDSGEPVVTIWEKMSKSKHNGVDPNDMFKEYGVDTTRLLILADVAPTSHRNWNSSTFPGILNWQKRLWLTIGDFINHRTNHPVPIPDQQFKEHDNFMFDSRNYYLKGVTFNYCGSQQHSVAISKQQGLTNSIRKMPPAIVANSLQFERALATQIILLAPMAPHFASELWSGFVSAPNKLNETGEIKWDKSVLEQEWPAIDNHYCLDLVCEINGDEVCVIKIPKIDFENLTEKEAFNIVFKQERVLEETANYDILNTKYILREGYESVVSIRTNCKERINKDKRKKMKKVKNY